MSVIAAITFCVVGLAGLLSCVWMMAYRLGFHEGRLTIPLRMIEELAEHQTACQDRPAERTIRDLVENIELPEPEARALVEKVQNSQPALKGGLRSA